MAAVHGGRASPFLDTNVLLYSLSDDETKADRVEALLDAGATIGVQVLNEFVNVARRKLSMPWPEVTDMLDGIRRLCRVEPLTENIHDAALALVQRHRFAWYDALIVAAAMDAGCPVLYSEDMQHGLRVNPGLSILNPFKKD